MSNTKGSMLISNANAVGTELVNQLGGTGYKPSEWSDAINLLGISDDDKASALAGITEGTYTGNERGAIKYSNCNAVGAMLNKKFSTNRGFKPVEWESAISKLTPLTEGTVSGSVCNIVNGAEDVPLKNWLVTLPASLSGYSSIAGTKNTGTGTPETQYTASLGRTIYGGTADIVNGEGTETYPTIRIGDLTFVKDTNCQHTFRCTNLPREYGSGIYNIFSSAFTTYINGNSTGGTIASLEVGNDNTIFLNGGSATFYITTDSSFDDKTATDFVNAYGNTELIYEATTPEAFTFTPITPTPDTALGANNFWSDQGDSSVTYRKDPDIPDQPVQLLNMNNNENNNNEEV